jgi:hypothetical protein
MQKGATLAAPFRLLFVRLEVELQSKLNQPWISGCGNSTKVDRANVSIRITEVSVVGNVKELRSEFKDLVLTYPRPLHHREIEDDVARSVEHVAAQTAETTGSCVNRLRTAI